MQKKKSKGRGSNKKKAPKISQTKLANKRASKLAKQGKLKREKKKSSYLSRSGPSVVAEKDVIEDVEAEEEERQRNELSEEDIEFYSTPVQDTSFIKHAKSRFAKFTCILGTLHHLPCIHLVIYNVL